MMNMCDDNMEGVCIEMFITGIMLLSLIILCVSICSISVCENIEKKVIKRSKRKRIFFIGEPPIYEEIV